MTFLTNCLNGLEEKIGLSKGLLTEFVSIILPDQFTKLFDVLEKPLCIEVHRLSEIVRVRLKFALTLSELSQLGLTVQQGLSEDSRLNFHYKSEVNN